MVTVNSDALELLGTRIRQMRTAKGWSQLELGRQAGVDGATVNRLENGKMLRPSSEVMSRIAQALEVSVGYLTGNPEPSPLAESDVPEELRSLVRDAMLLGPEDRRIVEGYVRFLLQERRRAEEQRENLSGEPEWRRWQKPNHPEGLEGNEGNEGNGDEGGEPPAEPPTDQPGEPLGA